MADRQDPFGALFDLQGEAMREMMGNFMPGAGKMAFPGLGDGSMLGADAGEFAAAAREIQSMWFEFMAKRAQNDTGSANPFDPAQWLTLAQGMAKQMPLPPIEQAQKLASDTMEVWQGVLGSFLGNAGSVDGSSPDGLPRKDRRFADPKWRAQPFYALVHQTYLMLAEQVMAMADAIDAGTLRTEVDEMERSIRYLVQHMPGHGDYLARYCPAPIAA